ncbi:MAG: YSC84-related protein [Gammaproteobacteria bacterium]
MNRLNHFLTATASVALVATIAGAPAALAGNIAQANQSPSNSSPAHNQKQVQHSEVQHAISQFKHKDPSISHFFDNAYGYAVFPGVGKGGLVLGGAHGGGEVYEHGRLVGHATITKFDIGAQAGGKTFAEVIFFKNRKAFDHFTGSNFQFSSGITAVGVKSGGAKNNDYSHGVAVFTMAKGGLMAGANIGGQKFSYTPLSNTGQRNGQNRQYGAYAGSTASAMTRKRTATQTRVNGSNRDPYNETHQGGAHAGSTAAAMSMNGTSANRNAQSNHAHHKAVTHQAVQKVIARYKKERPIIKHFFDNAYGYAVFPSVGKGGLVIGGAYGGGEVYKHDKLVGHATITKFDIGGQIGGQTFSEIVFFQNEKAFKHFTGGNYQFDANASAVGIKSGTSTTNSYSHGVAIFTHAKAGLMAGAAIGGQKFSFTPISERNNNKQAKR